MWLGTRQFDLDENALRRSSITRILKQLPNPPSTERGLGSLQARRRTVSIAAAGHMVELVDDGPQRTKITGRWLRSGSMRVA
jgi:hypothetical protein